MCKEKPFEAGPVTKRSGANSLRGSFQLLQPAQGWKADVPGIFAPDLSSHHPGLLRGFLRVCFHDMDTFNTPQPTRTGQIPAL